VNNTGESDMGESSAYKYRFGYYYKWLLNSLDKMQLIISDNFPYNSVMNDGSDTS
jgi:hypothetical protein